MDKDLKVDRHVLAFAFRYAMGRRSTAPCIVADNIKANICNISSGEIELYIKEIDECENYGMEMDKRLWLDLRELLCDELRKRNNK